MTKSSNNEQAEIDAALDAALDALDDGENNYTSRAGRTSTAPISSPLATGVRDQAESTQKKGCSTPSLSAPNGLGQSSVAEGAEEQRLIVDMIQQVLSSTGQQIGEQDFSEEDFGKFMQQMQSVLESNLHQRAEDDQRGVPSRRNESFAAAAATTTTNPASTTTSVDKTISDLVNGMVEQAKLSDSGVGVDDDEMLRRLMEGFGTDFNGGNADAIIDGMMEQLLAKELMYEPMKQVTSLFPKWLDERKSVLSKEDYEKRSRQYECFRQLVHVYEMDPTNSERLIELMQQVQEYGQPPTEIIQQIAPGLELDEHGMPKLQENGQPNEECRIM